MLHKLHNILNLLEANEKRKTKRMSEFMTMTMRTSLVMKVKLVEFMTTKNLMMISKPETKSSKKKINNQKKK